MTLPLFMLRWVHRGRGAGWPLADQVSVSVTTFVTGVLVARGTTKQEFGLYVVAVATLLFLTEAHHALVSTPHTVHVARTRGASRRRFNGSTLLHCLAFEIVCGVGLTVTAAAFWAFDAVRHVVPVLLACAATAPLLLLRNYARLFGFATSQPRKSFLLDAVVMGVQLGGLLVVSRVVDMTAWKAVLVLGAANGVSCVAWAITTRRQFSPKIAGAVDDFGRTWTTGRWILFSGLIWTTSAHGYPFVLSGTGGATATAAWGACFALASLTNPLLMGLQNVVGPKIARAWTEHPPAEFRRRVLRWAFAYGLIALPPAVTTAVLAPWFLPLYGDEYRPYALAVTILASAAVLQAVSFAVSRGLFCEGRAEQDLAANVASLSVMVVLAVPLARALGVTGAAACLVVGESVAVLYRCFAFGLPDPAGQVGAGVEAVATAGTGERS